MGRLGETREAAHFCMAFLDGYNMYTTGNFFPVAGGFNNSGIGVTEIFLFWNSYPVVRIWREGSSDA